MTGGAAASSIVTMGAAAPAATPSIVTMGASAMAASVEVRPDAPLAASPSVVAYGAPWPPVTDEKVAAVPRKKRPGSAPVVMRGGDGTMPTMARQMAGGPAPQPLAEPEQLEQ